MKSFLLLATLALCTVVLADSDDEDDGEFFIEKEGDLTLGGLFPLHLRGHNENTCGRFESMPGYHLLQSMLYAIDTINNDTTFLHGLTLGAKIYDSCHSQVIGARMTKKLITLTLVPPDDDKLVGVIGAQSSDLSKVVADFLRVFEIPQISYGSTATALSDKTIYSYFFRTVPPDTQQAAAMADIIVKLGWNYVIAVNSEGLYGQKGMEDFRAAAKKHGICIAQHLTLSSFPLEHEYDEVAMKLNQEPRARAVVLITELRDTRMILESLQRNNITKRFYWVGGDGWGNNDVADNFESFAEGAITLTHHNPRVEGFSEYFKSLNVSEPKNQNNSWLKEFWEGHFHCNLPRSPSYFAKNCSGRESLASSQFEFAPVQTVVNAVYAMAHALRNYLGDRCNVSDSKQIHIDRRILVGYLRNVSFLEKATGELLKFDKSQEISRSYSIYNFQKENGSYKYKLMGIWNGSVQHKLQLNLSKFSWPLNGNNPPVSLCSDACDSGYYRQRKGSHDIACCWTCTKCHAREVVVNNTCSKCPFGEVPNTNQSDCRKLPTLDALSRSSSQALVSISVLGLIFVIIAAAIFFTHSNVPLVKASSRELSGIILLGLALLFTFPWVLVAKPTPASCICRPIILGVALASCYAPLFMKILRIYRIFKSARKSAGKPILISPASQVLIAVALITVQILFSLISFFPTPPEPVAREINNAESLFYECSMEKDIFATLLSYNMFLMALCTVMAFKTRKFPRNFNEAKYIGFTMYFTCFVWIIFFPSYLSSGNGVERITWESSAVVLIGWITLIGLFGPKICHLVVGNHVSDTSDQLAVTNNTVSQAAVVQVSYNKQSSVDAHAKREDGKEDEKTVDTNKKRDKAVTTSC